MKALTFSILQILLLTGFSAFATESEVKGVALHHLRKEALQTIFSGDEQMHFSISWSGGVKIGDLYLHVQRDEGEESAVIHARVTDYGVFKWFYPVDDTFTTVVRQPLMLPLCYDVLQKEGWGGKETRRRYRYDQDALVVTYKKNEQPEQTFHPAGTVYNEFASFFINRAMDFTLDEPLIIPTFADKKRHEVKIEVVAREPRQSLFGKVNTIKIMPKMDFKGLYDKDGDTVFWLTDDRCRVPVEIRSKIVVGSLTAELVAYTNAACEKYTGGKKNTPGMVESEGR